MHLERLTFCPDGCCIISGKLSGSFFLACAENQNWNTKLCFALGWRENSVMRPKDAAFVSLIVCMEFSRQGMLSCFVFSRYTRTGNFGRTL